MNRYYSLCGLKVASNIELPELVRWNGQAEAPADLAFRIGKVPLRLEAPDYIGPFFQTRGRSEYLLVMAGAGRILVRDGNEVTVEPQPGTDPADTRAFLNGPVQAVLWHQRGLLPLHASAVVVNGRAVAIAGASGTGKSTLAAVLATQGYPLMADDICVIETSHSNEVSVLPGSPRLRLWRDALDHLGIEAEGLPRALSGKEKFLVDRRDRFPGSPQSLAAVVVLSRQSTGPATIARLQGARTTGALRDVVQMRGPASALGRNRDIFTALTQVTRAGVKVWQLRMPNDPACLEEAATKVRVALDP